MAVSASDCHNIQVDRQKKYYISKDLAAGCLMGNGLNVASFHSQSNLEIDLIIYLIHANSQSDNLNGQSILISADDIDESVTLTESTKSKEMRIQSGSFELSVPDKSIYLIGVQGEWLTSLSSLI